MFEEHDTAFNVVDEPEPEKSNAVLALAGFNASIFLIGCTRLLLYGSSANISIARA